MSNSSSAISASLIKLGADIRIARKRQRIKLAELANRMGVSVPTARSVEQGRPTVQMGYYAAALEALQMLEGLEAAAEARWDVVGTTMEAERLPKTIR